MRAKTLGCAGIFVVGLVSFFAAEPTFGVERIVDRLGRGPEGGLASVTINTGFDSRNSLILTTHCEGGTPNRVISIGTQGEPVRSGTPFWGYKLRQRFEIPDGGCKALHETERRSFP